MITNRDFLVLNYVSPVYWGDLCVGIYEKPVNLYYGSNLDPDYYPVWSPGTDYEFNDTVMESREDPSGVKFIFIASNSGRSGSVEPEWSRSYGNTTNDGSVVWKCFGSLVYPLGEEYYSYVPLDKNKFSFRRNIVTYNEEITIIIRKGCVISGHMLFLKKGNSTMLINGTPFEGAPIEVRRDLSLKFNLEMRFL